MSGATDKLLSKMSTESTNEEDQISEMLSQQKISNDENDVSNCANCGKEGSDLNICNKCKETTYCNATCKKKHRSKHKKQCERRVAELHDEALFREPLPQHGDCPICFLRMPTMDSGRRYYECCGKTICSGCVHAPVYDNHGNIIVEKKCPFCRTPDHTTDKEVIKRLEERMEADDAYAFYVMGGYYHLGHYGLPPLPLLSSWTLRLTTVIPMHSPRWGIILTKGNTTACRRIVPRQYNFFIRQESLDTLILA